MCLELVTRKDRLGSSKWSAHRAAHSADASGRNSRHHCKRWSIRCCERARHGGQTGSVTAGRSTRAAVSQQSQPIVVETRAVMHTPVLGRASERAKSWLVRARRKSIPPRKLERQEGGFRVGAVFIRSFGVLLLYKIRRYKAIEKCRRQRSTWRPKCQR